MAEGEIIMAYKKNTDLPAPVQRVLPSHAQEIYRNAFNNAQKQYKSPQKRRTKESADVTSRRVAWAAVEKMYEKSPGGKWVKIKKEV